MDAGTCAVAVCMTNVVVVAASNSFIMCAVSLLLCRALCSRSCRQCGFILVLGRERAGDRGITNLIDLLRMVLWERGRLLRAARLPSLARRRLAACCAVYARGPAARWETPRLSEVWPMSCFVKSASRLFAVPDRIAVSRKRVSGLFAAAALSLAASQAQAVGFQRISLPMDMNGPALQGAAWYPATRRRSRSRSAVASSPARRTARCRRGR